MRGGDAGRRGRRCWERVWLLPLPVQVCSGPGQEPGVTIKGSEVCRTFVIPSSWRVAPVRPHREDMSLVIFVPGWGPEHQPPHPPAHRVPQHNRFEVLGAAQSHGWTSPGSACWLRAPWACKARKHTLGCHACLCRVPALPFLRCATSPGGASVSPSANGDTERVL